MYQIKLFVYKYKMTFITLCYVEFRFWPLITDFFIPHVNCSTYVVLLFLGSGHIGSSAKETNI